MIETQPADAGLMRLAARRPGAAYAVDLRRRRSWHVDEPAAAPEAEPAAGSETQPGAPASSSSGDDWLSRLPSEAQAEIKELRKEAKERRLQLKQEREQNEQRTRSMLEEQGKFKELYEKSSADLSALKTKADRAEELEELIRGMVEQRINALPPTYRTLVPEFGDAMQTFRWLEANAKVLAPPRAPEMDAGQRGAGGGAEPLSAEELEMARRMRLTPEAFAKAKQAR